MNKSTIITVVIVLAIAALIVTKADDPLCPVECYVEFYQAQSACNGDQNCIEKARFELAICIANCGSQWLDKFCMDELFELVPTNISIQYKSKMIQNCIDKYRNYKFNTTHNCANTMCGACGLRGCCCGAWPDGICMEGTCVGIDLCQCGNSIKTSDVILRNDTRYFGCIDKSLSLHFNPPEDNNLFCIYDNAIIVSRLVSFTK